jgi:acetylglutamate kinase
MITVVKVGGKIIDNEDELKTFIQLFTSLKGDKILVHGGGKKASEISKRLGIVPQMNDGRRITDGPTLEVVTMVYGGLINKTIVSLLQAENVNAIGLSGADANVIQSHKREGHTIEYGFVGDIDKVNTNALYKLLKAEFVPVICPITHDKKGQLLNTNADTIAAQLAGALAKEQDVHLIYCFELKGVLKDVNDENSILSKLNESEVSKLHREGIIKDGMIPKLKNGFDALKRGVSNVSIRHMSELNKSSAGTQLIL